MILTFADNKKCTNDPKYMFCPAAHHTQILQIFTWHFCWHPMFKIHSGQMQSGEQIHETCMVAGSRQLYSTFWFFGSVTLKIHVEHSPTSLSLAATSSHSASKASCCHILYRFRCCSWSKSLPNIGLSLVQHLMLYLTLLLRKIYRHKTSLIYVQNMWVK